MATGKAFEVIELGEPRYNKSYQVLGRAIERVAKDVPPNLAKRAYVPTPDPSLRLPSVER